MKFVRDGVIRPNDASEQSTLSLPEVGHIETLIKRQRWQDALAQAQEALQRHPTSPRLNAQLGYCHWHAGRFEEAHDAFQRAVLCDTRFFEAGVMLVRTLDRLHRFREALEVAKHWTTINPNDPALIGLIRGLERQVPDELGQWTRSINTPEHYDVEIRGPES